MVQFWLSGLKPRTRWVSLNKAGSLNKAENQTLISGGILVGNPVGRGGMIFWDSPPWNHHLDLFLWVFLLMDSNVNHHKSTIWKNMFGSCSKYPTVTTPSLGYLDIYIYIYILFRHKKTDSLFSPEKSWQRKSLMLRALWKNKVRFPMSKPPGTQDAQLTSGSPKDWEASSLWMPLAS